MNENTEKQKSKVKVWSRDSVHTKHPAASDRKATLLAKSVDGSGEPDPNFGVKIRRQSKGFVVKTWDGKMVDAPSPRAKKDNNAPVTLHSGAQAKKAKKAEEDFLSWDLSAGSK